MIVLRTIAATAGLVIVLSAGVSQAAVCTVSGTTYSCPGNNAYNALNEIFNSNLPRAIANGDTISFSAGTTTFPASTLDINATNAKNFTIQGAGVGFTIWKGAAGFGGNNLRITTAVGTGPTRITGISLETNGASVGPFGVIQFIGRTSQLRLDNWDCLIQTGASCFAFYGHQAGVADHGNVHWVVGGGGIPIYVHNGQCWLGVCDYGDKSWSTVNSLDSSEKLVFEDVTCDFSNWQAGDPFTYRFCIDGWYGGRRVERFNTMNNTVTEIHGNESTQRQRGHMQLEVYNTNYVYNIPSGGYSNPIDFRGGYGMFFDNLATLSNGSVVNSIVNLKNEGASVGGIFANTPFGVCGRWDDLYTLTSITSSGTTATVTISSTVGLDKWWSGAGLNWVTISGASQANYNGTFQVTVVDGTHFTYTMPGTATSPATGTIHLTSPWNQNLNQYGDKCHDSAGVGTGDFLGGGDNPTPVGWSNNELRPVVAWNNLKAGVLDPATSQNPNYIVENTHFYTQRTTPSFNGTVGVGRGLRSARPATCTAGVYYWSTDGGRNWNTTNGSGNDGGLDKCTATNTWTNDTYVPTPDYPHPLIALTTGGGSSASATITSPSAGSTQTASSTFAVTFTATPGSGSITRVDVYINGSLTCSDTTSPFTTCNATAPATAGTYTLTAKSTDSIGQGPSSSGVSFTVPSAAASATITSPSAGSTQASSSSFSVSGTATAGSGSLTRVDVYVNGSLTCSDVATPWTVWGCIATAPATAGTYTLTAKATDGAGQGPASAGVNFTVPSSGPPSVTEKTKHNGKRKWSGSRRLR